MNLRRTRILLGSDSSRWLGATAGLCAGGGLLASHSTLVNLVGVRERVSLGTLLLLVIAASIIIVWPRGGDPAAAERVRVVPAVLTVIAGMAVLWWIAIELLSRVFAGPVDAGRGDMLVIMEAAVMRLLEGSNPYTVHRVPWDAPLSYGPLLWLPHLVSYLLRFDFRIFTLIAQFVVPVLCFISAGLRAGQGRISRATALFLLGAGIALHPGLRGFHQIGHTQVYWPVLAVFCLLLHQERWTAASICLGLLVSARTPMLSLVPVFFLYLYIREELSVRRAAAFVAAVMVPYLPFLIIDPVAVKQGVFDTYVRVIKTYVWQSTRWAVETYGVTGRLLEHGKRRYVELVQLLSLGLTYVFAWRSMARGTRIEPWLAFALLIFSMTTLFSIMYLYYDVWLLLACALIVHDGSWNTLARKPIRAIPLAFVLAAGVVFATASVRPGSTFRIDIGSPDVAGYTGGGFGTDVADSDNGRVVVWVKGTEGRIRLPRAGWTGGTIRVAVPAQYAERRRSPDHCRRFEWSCPWQRVLRRWLAGGHVSRKAP